MGTYVKRVQTVLTEEEYHDLTRLAEERQKPVSVLIREAIEEVYFQHAVRERRKAALRRLLDLRSPVSDWPEMEQEIARGAIER
ncbi:MAG: ribbon-helix-helix protein, CopG family [Chloroflexi bacterium]|nr:ribbon-helix-helix protein, CopG family [Chloroflexota bacterium]